MSLEVQALLPFLALLAAAVVVMARPRRAANGWIALIATGLAAAIILIELVRLAPGERVDVPYLTTFPYADLAIRLDALSLAFSTMTLVTASLLMLVRITTPGDRRDPWVSWLLTTLAVLAVIMAHNLLLVYILLQILTLAWSGTLDEAAPRRRGLRLAIGVADVGLLLAAAGAIQSVGTSAFSGVPSDTFGPAAFLLALIPVLTRIAALAWPLGGSVAGLAGLAPVAFEPAVAWAAPAAYLLLRLLALMGGRLPGRPVEVLIFAGGLTLAAAAALWSVVARPAERVPGSLLVSQAMLALALIASSSPLVLVASLWLWLQLIPLAGLCSVRLNSGAPAQAMVPLLLAMLPGSAAFIAIWIGAVGLRSSGQVIALVPVGLVVALTAVAGLARLHPVNHWAMDVSAGWAAALLVLAAFPALLLGPLVLPAAQAVRTIPGGTILLSPLGFTAAGTPWPALLATVLATGALALALRTGRLRIPSVPQVHRPAIPRLPPAAPAALPARWASRVLWTGFLVVVALAILRP